MTQTRLVEVRQNVLKHNDVLARELRKRFEAANVFVISLVSSPGAGKTEFLEKKEGLVELRHQLFENDALIFKKLESKRVSLLKNKIPFLKVHFQGFPHLGIWTPNNASFLCIEPWYGHSDTNESDGNLFNKEGIQIIDANKTFNSKFVIEII